MAKPESHPVTSSPRAAPVPLTETRRIFLDALDPAKAWAEVIQNPMDVDAMRRLAASIMGDVRKKQSWSVAWSLATKLAYHAIYKPFGLYVNESNLFAAIVGKSVLSPADMAGMQRLYTLAHAGCSTVLAWDRAEGRMVHFRSLDWPSADEIGNATRIFSGCRSDGSQAFAAAGILGMSGLLTAVKPGFSIAINFAPWRGPSLSLNADPTFLIRRLMTSSVTSYSQACAVIAQWVPSAPVFISLCGIDKGEGCLFEFGVGAGKLQAGPIGERDFLVKTNHFEADSPFVGNNRPQVPFPPPEQDWETADWDSHPIIDTSVARRMLLEEALGTAYANGQPFDLETLLQQAFTRRPVWNFQTAQWVMMVPQSGDIRVWTRA